MKKVLSFVKKQDDHMYSFTSGNNFLGYLTIIVDGWFATVEMQGNHLNGAERLQNMIVI